MKTDGRKRRSPLWRGLKTLYWTVFAISLMIVTAYVAFSLWARSPEIGAEAPVMGNQTVTDDPSTPEDESLLGTEAGGRRRKEDCHTFLLIGSDDGNGNADTIMAVTYDVPNRKVGVVSVPRDTLVNVPRTVKKINAAFGVGGVDEVRREVSDLLGYPVDHYIAVDLRAFKALVDAVDGVEFNVPFDMHYDDPTQDLHIHLKAGYQHLDGTKALQLARYRSGYANADIGRINTQQQLLTALAKKVISWNSIPKINEFVQIFSDYVETDLSLGNLAYFGVAALDLDTETGVSLNTLPGDGLTSYLGIDYYYELYPEETLKIINESLNPYTEPLTLEQTGIFQVP